VNVPVAKASRFRRLVHWLEDRYLAVDLRWLGAFRILYGCLLIADLLRHWMVLRDFYSNDGILPNHFSIFRPLGRDLFSLYHAFSTPLQVHFAFALTLLVYLTYLVGYRTRLFQLLVLICATSLAARNVLVENGGTVVVSLLAFWTLFLPVGKRLSLDSLLHSLRHDVETTPAELNQRRAAPPDSEASSLASFTGPDKTYALAMFALLLQWSIIYFFNCVSKLPGRGWENGSALHYFLHQDRIVTWLGIFMREHVPYPLLQGMTYATLVVEGVLAFILLIPFAQVWLRRVALLLAFGLHGVIAATSRLGPFSYGMTLFFVIPLSGADWRLLLRALAYKGSKRTVVFDDDCGVCFYICRVLKRLDLLGLLEFVGNSQRDRLPPDLPPELLERTVVVIDAQGRRFSHERAVSEVLCALPLGFLLGFWLRVPGLSRLARKAYEAFSSERTVISARLGLAACGVPAPPRVAVIPLRVEDAPPARHWLESLNRHPLLVGREVLVVLGLVMIINQTISDNALTRRYKLGQPVPLMFVMDTLRLYQGWRMFAPEPPYDDGHLVVDGRTEDGRQIDPFTGSRPDFDPNTSVGWGHNQFWCDYHLKMYFSGYSAYRPFMVEWLKNYHVRTGNPEDRLVAFEVWWVSDKSPPPGKLKGDPQPPAKIANFGEVKDSLAAPWLPVVENKPSAAKP
jgi:predicted DCC family thiol-disulfide oxidoreductase YuxK